MTFEEAAKYLLSLGNEVVAMKLGLENIRKLLAALGRPQNNFLKVQVAGTNGKGSVCAFLDAICASAGVKTGRYTSPHLVSITERIKVNGSDIREDDFARLATKVRETAEGMLADGALEYRPTFFEHVTAIALTAFAEAKVELAILETGLGGRLDATTAANAEIAAITRIDIDHQEYLGETIEEIAAEKAAIIDGPMVMDVVIGKQDQKSLGVVLERCASRGIEPVTGDNYSDWTLRKGAGAGLVKLNTNLISFIEFPLGLKGSHQFENAQTAVLISQVLQRGYVNLPDEAVFDGLQTATHAGRLEYQGQYLFDGAHNVAGAKALRAFLDESVAQPITLIFGAMKGKGIAKIAEILFPKAYKLILTQPENSRAMSAGDIFPFVPETIDQTNVFRTDTVEQALTIAGQVVGENGLILITGSLYLVGEAKKILNDSRI